MALKANHARKPTKYLKLGLLPSTDPSVGLAGFGRAGVAHAAAPGCLALCPPRHGLCQPWSGREGSQAAA